MIVGIVCEGSTDSAVLRAVCADVLGKAGLDEGEDLGPLCAHVKGWMAGGVPDSAVIVLPRESTEAWIVAAATRKKNVEAIDDPAQALVDAGVIGVIKGKPDKRAADYEAHIPSLLAKLKAPKELRAIPELARFVGKLNAMARAVSAKKRSEA